MRGRRILALILAVGLIAGVVVGAFALFSGSDDAEPDDDTDTVVTDLPTGTTSGGLIPEDQAVEREWGSIRFVVESEGGKDEKRINVFFVKEAENDQVVLHAASACSHEYLDEGYKSASCYGFADEEALEAAAPNPESGGMTLLCWRAFYSATEGNETGDTTTQKGYEEQGCP